MAPPASGTQILATAPISLQSPRRRRWWIPVTIGLVAAAVVVLLVLALVSVGATEAENFTLSDPGGAGPGGTATFGLTFPHSGTYDFSWTTTNARTVTFTFDSPAGTALYTATAASGHASVSVGTSGFYEFEVETAMASTVDVTGTLQYTSGLL